MPFDCDALLADGSVVTIRPAAAADRDALRALHEGLSPESLYLRFFSVSRQAALEYVDRLLLPQTSDHATLVGVAGDRMLAVGNFERLDGSPEAEIALVVADPEHGRGAGTLLIEDLAVLAREGGIRRFRAEILAENATMLHVLADTGFPVAKRYDDGVVEDAARACARCVEAGRAGGGGACGSVKGGGRRVRACIRGVRRCRACR